ncbi:MAG: polysaccharide biosynthesis C-terminal domain-containing protein [Cyclobacteriaceae bacterium]
MGKVIRKSFYNTIITFVGALIGYLNVLILFPKIMEASQIGLIRTLQDMALLAVPLAQLGTGQSLLKHFPGFEKKKGGEKEVFSIALLITVGGYLLFLALFFLFQEQIISIYKERAPEVPLYLEVTLILTFVLVVQNLLEALSRSRLSFVFIAFAREIIVRVSVAVVLVLYMYEVITFEQTLYFYILPFILAALSVLVYLNVRGGTGFSLRFRHIDFPFVRSFFTYGVITVLAAAGTLIVLKVDSIMVSSLLGLDANGVYTTVFYIAVIVEIPRRIIGQITTPLISKFFEEDDINNVSVIYKKSALNLLIVGGLLYLGILVNLENIFRLMPNGDIYRTGWWVVVIVGIGKLIDMSAGVNSEIIVMSRYYKSNLYFILVLAVMNIGLNLYLIPEYGLEGAATGSAISLVVFNLLKFIYIKYQFGFQPFTVQTLAIIAVGLVAYFASWLLPAMDIVLLDIAIRSVLVTVIFAGSILLFNLSPEIKKLTNDLLGKVGIKI